MAQQTNFTVSESQDADSVEISVMQPETLSEFVSEGLVAEDDAEGLVCNLAFQQWKINAQRAARDGMKAGENPQDVVDNYVYGGPRRAVSRVSPSSVSADEAEELGIDRSALEKLAAAGKIKLAS